MGAFDLDIDLYFWMIDRGEMEDDQRNKVEIEQSRVNLHREHSQRLENGIYIARIMQIIRRTIIKKSKSPFALDPQLNHLKDQGTNNARQYNWEVVTPELRKFGIKINKEKKQQIVNGKQSAIQEILQQLYDYDQAILTYPTVVGLKNSVKSPGKSPKQGNNNSELNFGLAQNSLEKADIQVGSSPKKRRYVQDSEKNSEVAKPIQLINLDSEELSVQNPRFRDKNNSPNLAQLNGADNLNQTYDGLQEAIGYDIGDSEQMEFKPALKDDYIEKVQSIHKQVGRNSIKNNTLKAPTSRNALQGAQTESLSILEFILDSLGQSLGMNSTQAAALLSTNHKFLVHLCQNGMKGQDFSKLYNWYVLLHKQRDKFVSLLESESDDPQAFSSALTVVKCGLFSHNLDIVNICAKTLTAFQSVALSREAQGTSTYGVTQMIWDWFVNSHHQADPNLPVKIDQNGVPPSPTKLQRERQQRKQKELEVLIRESGLKSFLRAYRRHSVDFVETFQDSLIAFGSDNYVELFTLQLRQNAVDNVEFLKINRDVFNSINKNQYFEMVMVNSGTLQILIEMCISLNDPRNAANVSSAEKLVSLAFLVDIWISKPMLAQVASNADAVIQSLKRGCRDMRSNAVRTTAIALMFHLLEHFAQGRNKYAPIIYKSLTFIVIDAYLDFPTREFIIKNFILLFQNHSSIPVAILSEPLLKQIKIYLEKQEMMNQQQPQNVLQPVQDLFSFNVIDFELFLAIAKHHKLDLSTAKELLSISCQISYQNILFTRVSLKLILQILHKYENNDQIKDQCVEIVSDLLNFIQIQDQKKIKIYNELKDSPAAKKAAARAAKGEESLMLPPSPAKATRRNSNPRVQSPAKNKQKLDDATIMSILDPQKTPQQSQEYMNMKTSEKLMVNLIQCIMGSGNKDIFEQLKSSILEKYIHIERQLRFNNKGLLYLLQLFDKEIGKTLQSQRQKQLKIQREEEEERIRQFNHKRNSSKPINLLLLQQAKRNSENHNTTTSEEGLRVSPDIFHNRGSQNGSIDDDFNDRDQNALQLPQIKGIATIDATLHQKNKNSFGQRARSIPNIGYKKGQQSLRAHRNQSNDRINDGAQSARNGPQFYYDINEESESEIKWYQKWLMKKQKLYKALFHKYASASVSDRRIIKQTFDTLHYSSNTMNLKAVHTFIQDFKITKLEFAKRDDIKKIIALINLKQQLNTRTISDLDQEGFQEFVLQMGFSMSHIQSDAVRKPPSQFMPKLFDRLKEASLACPTPLFQGLFDPQSVKLQQPQTETEILQLLTSRVNADNSYELPQGYQKYEIEQPKPLNKLSEPEWIAKSIIGDILQSELEIKIELQPFEIKNPIYQVVKTRQTKYVGSNTNTPIQVASTHQQRYKQQIDSSQSLDSINTEAIQAIGVGNGAKARRIKPIQTTDDSSNNYSDQRFALKNSPKGTKRIGYLKELENQPVQRFQQHKRAVSQARNLPQYQLNTLNMDDSQQFFDNQNFIQPRALLSPQTRGYVGPILNRVQLAKLEEKQRQINDQKARDERLQKRQITLKKQLQGFAQKKKEKEAEELQRQRLAKKNSLLEQTRQETIKKEMYEQIRYEYDQQRLPILQQNQQQQKQIQQQEKMERKKRREAAIAAQAAYTQKIKDDLKYKIQLKKEEEEARRQDELRKQEQDIIRRNKYSYVKSETIKQRNKSQSEGSESPKKHEFLRKKQADQRSLSVLQSRNKRKEQLKTDLTKNEQIKQLSPKAQSGRLKSAVSNRSNKSRQSLNNISNKDKLPSIQPAPQPAVKPTTSQDAPQTQEIKQKKGFFGKFLK